MISIKYALLFEIEILHSFYRSKKCPDILLVPTPSCQSMLKKFGLRYLSTSFGGQVYARTTIVGGKEIIKSHIIEGSVFSFSMVLKNVNFENFSDINTARSRTSHYYFNNLVNNLDTDSFPLLVANTSTKAVSDADLLSFVSHSFSYRHGSTASEQKSSLDFIDNGEKFEQTLNNHNNLFNFSYDLEKSMRGRASFFVEEVEKEKLYVPHNILSQELFGVVEIFYRSDLPSQYQFLKSDLSLESKFYKIAFDGVSTRWRYIINKRFNKTLTGVKVGKTHGNPIAFTALPNPPADYFIMASDQPVPLQEEPVTGIQLRDPSDKVLVAHLPNPSLMLVKTEGSNTFSDILITI